MLHVIALGYCIHRKNAFGTYISMDVERVYLIEGDLKGCGVYWRVALFLDLALNRRKAELLINKQIPNFL